MARDSTTPRGQVLAFAAACLAATHAYAYASPPAPTRARVEHAECSFVPCLGIDTTPPRFSWGHGGTAQRGEQQAAYQGRSAARARGRGHCGRR